MKLRPYQEECINAVEAYWADNPHLNAGVSLPTGAGKGHPLDTEVPTPQGIRAWGDLKVGDYVYGSDYRPTRVTAIFDRGTLPTYRVTFKDGATVLVDGEHLWSIQDYANRRTSREHVVIETGEMLKSDLQLEDGSYRFRVDPVSPDYDEPERPLGDLIHPYALGALLAEGSLHGTGVQFTSPDEDYVERVASLIRLNRIEDSSDVCARYSAPGLTPALKSLGLKVHGLDKFIPEAYFHLSAGQRLDLLRGLMDGDGSQRRGGRSSALFSTSAPLLAEGIVRLVTSLGGTAFVGWRDRGRGHSPEGTVQIRLPSGVSVFSIERHMGKGEPRRHFSTRRPIVRIERVEDREIRCITVEAEDHLYLITRSNIVTHNTVIMSAMAKRAVDRGERVVIIVHRHELVGQTVAKLEGIDPMMFVGVVKAQRNEVTADVVVASLQTLSRPGRAEKLGRRDLVIYDEAHGSASDSAIDVMTRLGAIGGDAKAVGFSATFYRADRRPLDVVWDDIVYERDILWAVREGFLSDATGISVPIDGLDLSKVKESGGDYQDRDLGQAMMDAHAAEQVAKAYRKHAAERKAICFAPTVAAAEAIAAELNSVGIPSETVTGKTSATDRRAMYTRLRAGATRVLCSVAVLTEGFDEPSVDCVIMARPTKSQGLYVQAVGRGLRLFPGKKDCLILDVSGSSEDNSLIALPDLAGVKRKAPDESLAQMAERPEAAEQAPRGMRANLRQGGAFDPFARRSLVWLETRGGRRFVATERDTYVFLHGDDGAGYRVGEIKKRSPHGRRDGKWLVPDPIPEEFALPLAEQFAEEIGARSTKAKYRSMGHPASVAQIGFASSLGVNVSHSMSTAEVSKAIDVALASAVID